MGRGAKSDPAAEAKAAAPAPPPAEQEAAKAAAAKAAAAAKEMDEAKAAAETPTTASVISNAQLDKLDKVCDDTPRCWGCGKEQPPAPATPFQSCARCREDGLEPSKFCSKECLKANWPRHRAWHAEQKSDGAIGLNDVDAGNLKEKAVLQTLKGVLKEQPASDEKKFMDLMMKADEHKLRGGYSKADSLLREAVKLKPNNPVGFAALGEVQALVNKPHAAAQLYVKAMSLYPKKSEGHNPQEQRLWASSALSAIFWLNVPGGKPEEMPEWFSDLELKDLTAQLVELAPTDLRSWQTRAFVLCPMPDMPPQWHMPPGGMMRSEAELQEAGRCWQKVMAMTPGGKEAKRPYVMRAAHCFRSAQMVAEKLRQQAEAEGRELPPAPPPPKPMPTTYTKEFAAAPKQFAKEAIPAW